VTQIRPSHHLDRPSNRRDLVEPDRKAQGFALEPVEALPMLIEVWLCQKTDGARRPSAVGLTQVLRRRAALRGSLGVRLLRKLLTNPLAQPRSTANVTNRRRRYRCVCDDREPVGSSPVGAPRRDDSRRRQRSGGAVHVRSRSRPPQPLRELGCSARRAKVGDLDPFLLRHEP
jgi:hypothetical protein